jgi:hypothetical protein
MKCYICGADSINRHGRANRCEKHHRFAQMQKTASVDGKYVPSFYELEKLVREDMTCPDCSVQMHWIDDNNRSSGVVLQHYRDGTIGLVCHSCNVKHGQMPGDMYRQIPRGHKLCTACKTIKPLGDFNLRRDSKKPYPLSKCKSCMNSAQLEWRKRNPEQYKKLTQKHNQKRKEALNGTSI